ncbi:MAG: RHS repeat-associated core domain-containing protein [Chitinophagaceae bacterium]|nr:RHS repeat-associated core domain-containing protein [Chitinophagaceae bacterium]
MRVIKRVMNILLQIMIVFAVSNIQAQNVNSPNKMGPLGTQVNTLSGNLYISRNDIYAQARGFDLNINFSYNSFRYDQNEGFGNGWSFGYGIKCIDDTAGSKTIVWGDGREDHYAALPGNAYKKPKGVYSALTQYQPGKYLLKELNGIKYFFDNNSHRKITRLEDPNGNFLNFNYSDSLLVSVNNAAGQSIAFTYYANGRLASVVDAMATPVYTYTYTYDAIGNLKQVTNPMGGTNKYTYLINGPMKTITDKNNNTVNVIYYNDFTVSELIGCNKRLSFSYNELTNTTMVTDHIVNGNNQVSKYEFQKFDDVSWLVRKSGNCCGYNVSFEYDSNGNVVKETDANGNATNYSYDGNGNVIKIIDPLGHTKTFTYSSAFNNMLSYTDAMNYVQTMQYDVRGNLTQFIEPNGSVTSLTYSANGDLMSITNPGGQVTQYTYDAFGNPAVITQPLGISMSFLHDARGNLISATDERGFNYTYQYDSLNRIKSASDPMGHNKSLFYDAEGNLVSISNENGQINQFSYDASNRVVANTNPMGYKTFFTYDAVDNLIQMTDALGKKVSLNYDGFNRLKDLSDPMGNSSHFVYDGNGNLVSVTFPSGRVINNTYDKLNRLIKSEDGMGLMGSLTYDNNGNLTSRTLASGSLLSYTYDTQNRIKTATDPLGNIRTYNYDNNSNLLSVQDRNGRSVSYTYDQLDRVIAHTDENNFTTSITYDAGGNVLSVNDQNNHVTSHSYDSLNRLMATTYPDGRFLQFTYDNLGNVVSKKATDGSVINYQYDSINRLVVKNLPDGNVVSFGYDALNRLISAVNNSSTVTRNYNSLNLMTSETLNGKTTGFTYDIPGMRKNIIYPDSTIVTKSYNNRKLLSGIAMNNVSVVGYQYNKANQLTSKNYSNGLISNMQYDFAGRLSNLSTGNGAIQNNTYSFDKELNKATVNKSIIPGESEQINYDAAYRLSEYKRGQIGSTPDLHQLYGYDALGNRTSLNSNGTNTTYTANNLNQLTNSSNINQTINYTFDNNGNLTYDGTYHKAYDAEGRLKIDSASPSNKIQYLYDAFGRRITKTVNGIPYRYIYDGICQIQQRDGNTDTLLDNMVFVRFNTPVAHMKNGQIYYYHLNEMNSVDAITKANGNLVERYVYDAFGNQLIYDSANQAMANSIIGNRFGFTGQEYDSESKSIHFHFRNYSPVTGTFNQRDPTGYLDGMGLYQYAHNNPASYTDQMGLKGGPFSSLGNDPLQDVVNLLNNTNTSLGLLGEKYPTIQKNVEALEDVKSVTKELVKNIPDKYYKEKAKWEKVFKNAPKRLARKMKNLESLITTEEILTNTTTTVSKINKVVKPNPLIKLSKYGGPLFNTIDLGYKVWKAREPKKDACGNIVQRTSFEQARLNFDVGLTLFSYTGIGSAYSLVDWGFELAIPSETGGGLTTRFLDLGEMHGNWMDNHPDAAQFEMGFCFVATIPGYLSGAGWSAFGY